MALDSGTSVRVRARFLEIRHTPPCLSTLQLRVNFSLVVLVHLADSQVEKDVLTTAWDPCTLYLSCDLGHELSLSALGVAIAAEEYLSALGAFVQHKAGLGLSQSRQSTQLDIGFSLGKMTHLICKGSAVSSVHCDRMQTAWALTRPKTIDSPALLRLWQASSERRVG
jgi:hypothetical protein